MKHPSLVYSALVAATIAWATAPAAARAAGAEKIAHLEARVDGADWAISEPRTTQESLAALRNGAPNVMTFGITTDGERRGIRQYFIGADGSGIEIRLSLPPEMAAGLKPGTYGLGNVSVSSDEVSSHMGWSSKCPDTKEKEALLSIRHYAKPGPQDIRMPMVPSGAAVREYQTHITRLREDKATFTITLLDPVQRWVEGSAKGEVSWVVPKDADDVNDRKTYDWMCRPGEYVIKTEPFELHFALHLDKRAQP